MTELAHGQPTFPRLFTSRSDSDETPERRWPNLPKIPLGLQLFVLFLLCLVPRAWVASLMRTICHDGFYYISTASAFEHGDWARAFAYLNLNIYPLILLGLHSLGLEWIFAGKVWSVLVASLAVLPLFGWVRRLFCDQVAWSACFLYSVHAEFVERSFEPTRDPTFWFLFNLCLYTTVRAISEAKPRWFLANGFVLTLAIHTRSEGWLLLIPFGLWLVRQWFVKSECRKPLFAGTLLSLAVLPCVILLINLTVLREEPEWQLGRLNHFALGWNWLQEKVTPAEPAEATPLPPIENLENAPAASVVASPSKSNRKQTETPAPEPDPPDLAALVPSPKSPKPPRLKTYLKEMATALEQLNLTLLVFGLCWLGRDLLDWNRGTLFVLAAALAGAIWVVYATYGHLNGRYYLPIYLALMPYFGIGYLVVFDRLWNRAENWHWTWFKPEYTAIGLIVVAIGLGWADALTTDRSLRNNEVRFGDWLDKTHGPFRGVVTDSSSIRSAYYAQKDLPFMLQNWSTLTWQYADQPRDLIILAHEATPPAAIPLILAEAQKWGLEPLAIPKSVCGCDEYLVFVRPPQSAPAAIIATEPQDGSARQ